MNIIIANAKDWFKPQLDINEDINVHFATDPTQLNRSIKDLDPTIIFFIHWHWKVSSEIFERIDCILFHLAPLPYGRGGSPIQNLIIRGFRKAPVCALKMVDELDAGPIYLRTDISLEGDLQTILADISEAINVQINTLLRSLPEPIPQSGDAEVFRRLSSQDNEILPSDSISLIYDKIRMVDAPGYSRAFIKYGEFQMQFSTSTMKNGKIIAMVEIEKCK